MILTNENDREATKKGPRSQALSSPAHQRRQGMLRIFASGVLYSLQSLLKLSCWFFFLLLKKIFEQKKKKKKSENSYGRFRNSQDEF